jgi:ribosomal protein S18 acetylase RimI-like enzyme
MNEQPKMAHEPTTSVEFVETTLSQNDLNDLCDATDAAIEDGGGFGWVNLPAREVLEGYWNGVVTAPTRELFVARLDNVICGTTQVVLPPKNNEAQGHMVTLTTQFVTPWARGHGLAKMLLQEVEKKALRDGYGVINLDVRETMVQAISLYESLGYIEFGKHPYSVRAQGETITSKFYYKVINEEIFKL